MTGSVEVGPTGEAYVASAGALGRVLCRECSLTLMNAVPSLLRPGAVTVNYAPEVAADGALLAASAVGMAQVRARACDCCPAYVLVETTRQKDELRISFESLHDDVRYEWLWSSMSGLVESPQRGKR